MASYSEKIKQRNRESRSEQDRLQEELRLATTPKPVIEEVDQKATIHVYGDTSEGKIVAHSLQRLQQGPKVTLLFGRTAEYERWKKLQEMSVKRNDSVETSVGYEAELGRPPFRRHGRQVTYEELWEERLNPHWEAREPGPPDTEDPPVPDIEKTATIQHLVMAVQPHTVVPRLQGIMHRLRPDSTILLAHQGLGVLERVVTECYPDADKRPNLIQGFSTHRLYQYQNSNEFGVNWYQPGSLTIAPLPRFNKTLFEADSFDKMKEEPTPQSTDYLIDTLKRCGGLLMNDTSVTDLYIAQLEALVVDSIIQPLSALADVRNGQLLYSHHFTVSFRLLLTELSIIIRSLPELQSYPNLETRFSPERLETLVVAQLYKTSLDWSTMALDVRSGRISNINYMNGYLIKRGEEIGVKCWMNYMILHLIKGKASVIKREREQEIPS